MGIHEQKVHKREIFIAVKYMKRCENLHYIKEMMIKPIMSYHLLLAVSLAQAKTLTIHL